MTAKEHVKNNGYKGYKTRKAEAQVKKETKAEKSAYENK